MKRILITSGPTREYLDPVRYLTNASSGRMGAAVAQAALDAGFLVTVVSGPVAISYPSEAEVVRVVSTAEMLHKSSEVFPECVGVFGVAAPCDFAPVERSTTKLTKEDLSNQSAFFSLQMTETPDIIASLGKMKTPSQWSVAFALETHDHHNRAMVKRLKKNADFIALNRPAAIGGFLTSIELFDADGTFLTLEGDKPTVAALILKEVLRRFPLDANWDKQG